MSKKTLYPISIAGISALVLFSGAATGQTNVTGTGDPDIDVAAVQAAADRGGSVVLKGISPFTFRQRSTGCWRDSWPRSWFRNKWHIRRG